MPEAKFDPLIAEVTALTTVTDSAIALIDGMIAAVNAAKDDPAEIAEVVASFSAQRDRLAAAVAANTPTPEPGPGPEPPLEGRRRR